MTAADGEKIGPRSSATRSSDRGRDQDPQLFQRLDREGRELEGRGGREIRRATEAGGLATQKRLKSAIGWRTGGPHLLHLASSLSKASSAVAARLQSSSTALYSRRRRGRPRSSRPSSTTCGTLMLLRTRRSATTSRSSTNRTSATACSRAMLACANDNEASRPATS